MRVDEHGAGHDAPSEEGEESEREWHFPEHGFVIGRTVSEP
jgi:hypothetical protein